MFPHSPAVKAGAMKRVSSRASERDNTGEHQEFVLAWRRRLGAFRPAG
jgi:hypothetical protein